MDTRSLIGNDKADVDLENSTTVLRDLFQTTLKNSFPKHRFLKIVGTSVIMLSFGIATALPTMAPARLFAKGNIIFEYMYPIGEGVAISFMNAWLLKNIAKTMQTRMHHQSGCVTKSILFMGATILGAATSLPSVLISLTYNHDKSWLAVLAFMGDTISNTYSFNQIAHNLLHQKSLLGEEISHRLELGLIDVINLSEEETQEFFRIHDLENLINPNNAYVDQSDITALLRELIQRGSLLKTKRDEYASCYKSFARSFFTYGEALFLPFIWLPPAFKIIYNNFKYKSADLLLGTILGASVATASTAPLFFLFFLLGKSIANDLWEFFADIHSGTFKRSFSQKKFLPLILLTSALALSFSGFSFGTMSLVVSENFDGLWQQILLPTVASVFVLIRSYALLKCVDEALHSLATTIGSQQTLAKLTQFMQQFIDHLSHLPLPRLQNILHSLSSKEDWWQDDIFDDSLKQLCEMQMNNVLFKDAQKNKTEAVNSTYRISQFHGSIWQKQQKPAEKIIPEPVKKRSYCVIS